MFALQILDCRFAQPINWLTHWRWYPAADWKSIFFLLLLLHFFYISFSFCVLYRNLYSANRIANYLFALWLTWAGLSSTGIESIVIFCPYNSCLWYVGSCFTCCSAIFIRCAYGFWRNIERVFTPPNLG